MGVSPLRGSVKRLEAGDSSSRAMQLQISVELLTQTPGAGTLCWPFAGYCSKNNNGRRLDLKNFARSNG
jgi:hypothetical protein